MSLEKDTFSGTYPTMQSPVPRQQQVGLGWGSKAKAFVRNGRAYS